MNLTASHFYYSVTTIQTNVRTR